MPESTRAATLEVMEHRLKIAEAKIDKLTEELETRRAEERRRLMWGISALGTVVIALASVIWNWRSVILRGAP